TQLAEEEAGGGYAEGEWVDGPDGQLMWQPAGGGEAISAAEAGYGTIAGGEAPPPVAPETRDLDDEAPAAPAAEEAAVHVDETVADTAGDELAADADLGAQDADVQAEAEAEIDETAGDQS